MKNKLKVLAVFGTRPEAIKMAPLVLELQSRPEFDCRVALTAQHREILDSVLKTFDIKPDYDLNIMTPGQSLCTITAKVISGLDGIFQEFSPDLALVHGDTTTTMSAAIAAFYNQVMIGHVEAGLRTYDKKSPYPEEANRLVTGDLADLHFCPTKRNYDNLLKENIKDGIFITGNTVIDALKYTVKDDYQFQSPDIARAVAKGGRLILMTAHRRENFGKPHEEIFSAVRKVAQEFPDLCIVYPVHPNPQVKDRAERMLGDLPNVVLTSPIDTDEMHNLMKRSYLILTDSGGLQEEGPSLGKPVLVLRRETERPEAVDAGTVLICGVEEQDVYEKFRLLLTNETAYQEMAKAVNPYGDGNASRRIADGILYQFGYKKERPEDFRA